MKCPNPDCPFSQNEELKETCKFCSECGYNLREVKKTTSLQNENAAPLSEDSKQVAAQCDDLHYNAKVSTDIADQQQKRKVEETEDKAATEMSGEPSSDQSTLLGSDANETKSEEQQQTEHADGQQKRNVEKIEDKPATEKLGEPSSGQSTPFADSTESPMENRALKMKPGGQHKTELADKQKRKVEELDDKPASEKSGEPSSGQSTVVADSTASPIENLALETKSGEQQKTEHCGFPGGNISSNLNPQEAAGYNSPDQDDEQQKRKAEELEDKPATEKSGEPSSGQSTLADSTSSTLENLALEMNSEEQQKTVQGTGGNISSNPGSQEAADYNGPDKAYQLLKRKVEETEDKAATEKSGEPSSDQSTLLGSNANETKSEEQQQTEHGDGQQKRNVEKIEDKPATEKFGEPSSGQSTPFADSTESPMEKRALKMKSGEQQKTEQADEQQKRKVEELDDKPASEKSGEPSSGQSTVVADSTASPIENLALETKSGEQQKTEHCGFPGGNISSNLNPQEAAGYNSPGDTSKAIKAVLVKEDNIKASSHEIESNQPDEKNISNDGKNKNGSEVDSNIEILGSKDVDVVNKVDSTTSSQSKDGKIGSRSNQSEDALVPNNDNTEDEDEDEGEYEEETESDSEEDKPGLRTKLAFWRKSKGRRAREKKKKRKKRKEKKQQEAAQKERNNGSGVNNQGPPLRSNDGNEQKNQATSDNKQPENDRGDNNKDNNRQNAPNSEFFGEDKRKKMTVFFHAVLAPHFNFEADQGDRIFMRFGGPAFGDWNVDVVEVHPERMLENDYILVQAELLVPFTLLFKTVLYKYIVRKTNAKGTEEIPQTVWENIPGRGIFCNRCLQVPKERCKPEAVWHQYDDTIFSPPNWFQSIRNLLPSFLKGMDAAEGRKIATWAMLPSWEGFVVDEGCSSINAWAAVAVIQDLAGCMTKSVVQEHHQISNVPASYNFKDILKAFLKGKIDHDSSLSLEPTYKNFNRLVSAVAIAYVLFSHNIFLDGDDYRGLFLSLRLFRHREDKTCPALDVLLKHFDPGVWQLLGEAIQGICRYVARTMYDLHDWFFAVPLVHFLTQSSKPFSNDVLLMEEPKPNDDTWWGAVGFDTKTLREKRLPDKSCPSTWINMLSSLFELDPLFRRTFLLANSCPAFDKIASSRRFPPVEIYATLAKIISEKIPSLDSEREGVATGLLVTRQNVKAEVRTTTNGGSSTDGQVTSTQEAILCVKSCLCILRTLSLSCKFNLLQECLQSIAMWVAILEEIVEPERDDGNTFKEMENVVVETFDAVKKWLKKSLLSSIPCYTIDNTDKELKIWTNLWCVEWGNKSCNEIWSNRLTESFKLRLEERDCNDLVEVFTKANMAAQDSCVRNLVSDVTFKKVDNLLQRGNENENLFKNLSEHGLQSPQASKCGDLLTLMLTKCWPKSQGGIPCSSVAIFKHVLEWRLWLCFFERFGPESDYRKVLKEDGQEILLLAQSSLEAAVGYLKDGSIEVRMLAIIRENSERFLILCKLISKDKDEHLVLEKLLDQRCKELCAFQDEQAKVSFFIRMSSSIKQVDLEQLSVKCGTDASCLPIKDLVRSTVVEDKVVPAVTFFGLSPRAKQMISSFSKLTDSTLLRQFWKENGEKAMKLTPERRGRLSVDDVEELVWTPSFKQLLSLQELFLTGSITFEEVDKFLMVFTRNEEIAAEINLITSQNFLQTESTRALIHKRIEQIHQYRKLQNCIDAAKSVLEFKECLNLKGDFQLVEDLNNQMNTEFKRRPLKSINPALQRAGESLSSITYHRRRCLNAVARCQTFISWLRKTVKGPQELKVLVDLAIISAGETDTETARITCLHTSCLGFAPLIFDVKPSFGFNTLMKTCKPVWDAVESDPKLPDKLIDTSYQLPWLKGIETSHGSVAKSSLLDAQAINGMGLYRVGCPNQDGNTATGKLTLDEVIQLIVPQGESGEQKYYSLDDLRDLQSKLMLIAAKALKKEEVDRFVDIFQCVLRLGEAYISLCKAGEVSHLKWKHEFRCTARLTGPHSLPNDLKALSDEMELCLQLWKRELHTKRLHYKELNHYTTIQLLFLRSKLADVQGRGAKAVNGIPLDVYNLLESVLPGVEPSILKTVLLSCGICSEETGQSIVQSFHETVLVKQPFPAKKSRSSLEEMFQSLVARLESIGCYSDPEEIAIAALISCKDASEADLIVWCVNNGSKEDLIHNKYSEALSEPRFLSLVDKDVNVTIESPFKEETTMEPENVPERMETSFTRDQTAGGKFLSLDDLGKVLNHLGSLGSKKRKRRHPRYLKKGKPNFVVIPKDDILGTVLSLYMHDTTQSLPLSEEVLICTSDTTAEEIELLWRRSLGDQDGGLFCLVNVDNLDYSVSQRAADTLSFLLQEPPYNRNEELCLVVICSSENEDRAHMAAALDQYRLGTVPHSASPKEIRQYVKTQFRASERQLGKFRDRILPWTCAAMVEKEKLSVRVFSSERAGSGKTLAVHRLSEKLCELPNNDVIIRDLADADVDLPLCITTPIYGPAVKQCSIAECLLPHVVAPDLPLSRIFHLDVHPSVTTGLDTLLFNLLVLGVLKSSSGQVWRRRTSDLYVIELTTGPAEDIIETVHKGVPLFKSASSKKRVSEPFYTLLPTIHCGTPKQALWQLTQEQTESLNPLFDDTEFRSQHVQRTFQYLKLWESAKENLDHFWFIRGKVMGDYTDCIETLTRNCGITDPTWAELRHFISFLNAQLQSCEESTFCNMEHVGDTLEGFRSFVVQFMILMSRDFATPSLGSTDQLVHPHLIDDDVDVARENVLPEVAQFCLRRHWETSPHPYVFFNQDGITMTFVGFHIDRNGNLIDPDRHVIIQPNLMSRHLRTGLTVQFQFGNQRMDFETNYETWSKGEKIEKLCGVMGVEWPYDPENSYELTTDNLMKILAIHMRFRCGIPVIVMGETGCGKTCLIRYMCGLQSGPGGPKNMLLMKVHGGTTYEDIAKRVEKAEEMATLNEGRNIDTVLFFDEANTTDALGMIKEVMVDRRVNGRKISAKRLQFIAACNPYRKHTEEMIHKLESAGLGYHVATQHTRDRLGRIPLRHLVYRVHSLPESMRPLVWDFGQLKPEIEKLYTSQIVNRFVLQENQIPGDLQLVKALTEILTASQRYMREQTDECSFVSLRDVERAMKVMVWFYNHRNVLNPLVNEAPVGMDVESDDEDDDAVEDERAETEGDQLDQPIDDVTRALVLSLGVCYQARLQDREPFRRAIAPSFSHPCLLPGGHRRIQHEITRCQKAVLNVLKLGQNIARNTALSENVFMMVVCIELRIPLFVVGKPGSSKSLAKTVVAANMEGDASRSDLFKTFKQVHMVSYQCSPLSTAEGIKATFRQCSQLQKANNPDKFVSVVVLDEVGLAEDSPLMPLKTLHPLLEDGVSATDDIIEVEEQKTERVAFIGISNWALDPAKMNRGIMLSRGIPDTDELVDSAMGICSTDKRVQSFVEPLMDSLAQGYEKLYERQRKSEALRESKKDEFFGLRDFYSLVKMVYKMAEDLGHEPGWKDIEHAIRRNFGGLDEIDPVKIFKKQFPQERRQTRRKDHDAFSAVNLIKASLDRQISSGESRYLLVLTENYAALPIVQQELHKKGDEPIVIFGSSFPKDQEYTQVCRDINRIKVCMETGRTVILLNLESLYESLYDALNQYYMYFGGQKYVDLGLGSHRVKCRVDDKFRLIVVAERDVVYSKFPIPLINRLEKHYLVTSASLNPQQKYIVHRLHEWVKQFSTVEVPRHQQMRKYTPGDAFVGYHADTAATVVLQVASNHMEDGQDQFADEEKVFKESQELLLQCATPDAVARLPRTQLAQQADILWSTYFTMQEHSSLTAFLRNVLTGEERGSDKGTLIQVTTHSRLLSSNDLQDVADSTSLCLPNVMCLSLQQFHTEQQFCSSVRDFIAKLGGREGLLIVQCDAGDVSGNLIPCARHLLVEQRTIAVEDFANILGYDPSSVHIVMIVQLPRVVGGCQTFAGFQGGRWISVHIDELRPPTGQIPAIEFMVDRSVSELFDVAPSTTRCEMEVEDPEEEGTDIEMEPFDFAHSDVVLDKVDIVSLLRSCVQAAVARIDDESWRSSRSTRRIEVMLNFLPDDRSDGTDLSFATILARRIHKLLQEKDDRAGPNASDWLRSEALSGIGIHENGTFRKALWQRVYSSVIPILSEIIAFVDRDSNLELLMGEGDWLSHLWIVFFQDQAVVELHYDNFLSLESSIIRERVPVTTSGREGHMFDVQFPFSWLVKERIDTMWREAASIAERSRTPVQQRLHDLISNSEIGPLIEEAQQEGYGEAAVLHYLHDFVHMVHKPTVPDGEVELICQVIITAARELHGDSHSLEEFSLSIPLIHVVYEVINKRLANLSRLIEAQPDIMIRLSQVIPQGESEMVHDAVALQLCLSKLEPNEEEFDDPQTRLVWCNRVLAIRSSANNLLNNSAQYGLKTAHVLHECRSIWQRVSAVRLFIEHTCPGTSLCHPADVKNTFKLWKALGVETDFTKPDTMRVIEKFLVDCSEAVSKRYTSYGVTTCPVCLEGLAEKDPVKMPCSHVICLSCISHWIAQERKCPLCKVEVPEHFKIKSTKDIRQAVQEHYDFRRRCNSFFMELVSLFCFGAESGVIDAELFSMFMSYVLKASSKTKAFSPFPEHGIDATPVVRSFLLQQLLRNSDEEVKEHLSHYLSETGRLRPDVGHLLQVCQLFVYCWEDSLISQYANLSDDLLVMIKLTQQLCHDCTPHLTSSTIHPVREVDVVLLESVAKARYILGLAAQFMHKAIVEDSAIWNDFQIRSELQTLFEAIRRMCLKSLSPSPRLYLLKQLARRFGVEAIHAVCEINDLDWIVPPESRDQQQEDLVPDRFIIYGEHYKTIREAMAKTVLSGSNRELTATLQTVAVPPVVKEVMVLLSEYREVTTCYRFTATERRLSARAHQTLEEFIQGGTDLSNRTRPFAFHLLNNTLGALGFPSTRTAPGRSAMEQNLCEIVIHTVMVLQFIDHVTVCEPLRLMMENPAALRNAFLPTMPEDNLQEAMAGMQDTGAWYQCPKGHPYYIGDCGRPVEVRVCPECKVNIGGTRHNLSQGNTVAQRADRTMRGHVLGDPTARSKSLASERNLSSVVVGITRILMHCAMIEGACRQPQDVASLINPRVPPEALARFLWDHLRMDLELLAKSLGRSVDDTILCIHMILTYMTSHVSDQRQAMVVAPDLTSKASRRDWETAFNTSVLTPTMTNLEERVQYCLELLVGDNRLGNNPLMRQLYEVDVPPDTLTSGISPSCPALWRYRTQVTLDHFSHTFQQQVLSTDADKNKVLAEFLRQEHKLRALRFLPDIVKLQRLLMDKFHRRIDRTEAENIRIRDFLKKVPSKSAKDELTFLIASFNKAWNHVRQSLDQRGRLRPPSDLCQIPMDNSRPLALLLPSTSGMGICSMALVFYLTTVHNEFNERYQNLVGGEVKDLPHIQLQDVTTSQLISYDTERDLLPLILAQCNYSLEVGKGTLVQYNWEALERQLIDRFIGRRPLIDFKAWNRAELG
ncbi:E3 ubiquitin-protein ligase rnf213-alpha-like isoform X2 [Montipora foliosa]|uniref:E3 ubiquitin-protein ligase rnf213-alpha-like isoform X2 n=1 Tax=Montipora foliosa TaxID=591990 RepID=UPI0035F1E99B